MKKDTSINVKCAETLKRDLRDRAEAEGMTFSDFIRWILRKATKDNKDNKNAS